MSATVQQPFFGWLAHDENNKVVALYAPDHDTSAQEVKELAKLIRRGLIVRRIIDEVEVRGIWSTVVSERKMKNVCAPPDYDDDEGSATVIAMRLVELRGRK